MGMKKKFKTHLKFLQLTLITTSVSAPLTIPELSTSNPNIFARVFQILFLFHFFFLSPSDLSPHFGSEGKNSERIWSTCFALLLLYSIRRGVARRGSAGLGGGLGMVVDLID